MSPEREIGSARPGPDTSPEQVVASDPGWRFDHSYASLPAALFAEVRPTPVPRPELLVLNERLARDLGLDPEALTSPEQVSVLSGSRWPAEARPLAQAYAGHQFGHFTMLGDGRALLLGEHLGPDDRRVDVQWKGSGRTPFSRGGDGRAVVGPMLREYVIGEAMHRLGVPSTRILAVVATGETIRRDRPLPGAVLTRVASSHLRVGTFQYAAALREHDVLERLARYALDRHFPDLAGTGDPGFELLEAVADRQASLVARWLGVGFVHGVMNTDNMALSGETIDYGPCAFLDAHHPDTVFSSIDRAGRYAYGNQPAIAQWNLARFAEALLPLFDRRPEAAVERAQELVDGLPEKFERSRLEVFRAKLGLTTERPEDRDLIDDLLSRMADRGADHTRTFLDLTVDRAPLGDSAFETWLEAWRVRRRVEGEDADTLRARMGAVNPAVIPRNHRVQEALDAAEDGDVGPFQRLLDALEEPYDHSRSRPGFEDPPPPGSPPCITFCGT